MISLKFNKLKPQVIGVPWKCKCSTQTAFSVFIIQQIGSWYKIRCVMQKNQWLKTNHNTLEPANILELEKITL